MIDKKRVAITALKYSTLATIGFIIANVYVAPRMEIAGATKISVQEIVVLIVIALPLCFVSFALIFAYASWMQNRDSDN